LVVSTDVEGEVDEQLGVGGEGLAEGEVVVEEVVQGPARHELEH
jgi:hypothetical protein